ncbi:esterase OVCA2-like [Haliotis cracherodii]|uniref:esterase OVCA2-like n=1 Tax=Haliotis cracherodii TaxID=6455 RepID=UPI0039ECAAE9
MASSKSDVLRILCLHGYRQNGQTFRERTGAFRKITKKHAELVFITAPNIVPSGKGSEDEESSHSDERGWWFSHEDDSYSAQDVSECCKGCDESVEMVKRSILEQGPFDGILGFSQGACMLSLICCLRERDPDLFKFNFAIFIAGFKSRCIPHESFYETLVTIPTLHVFGDTDKVIPKEMSEALLPCYKEPVILQHPGGHFIPASSQQKQVYLQFLDKMAAIKS